MKWVLRILGGIVALVVLFVAFVWLSLRPNIPQETFDVQPSRTVGTKNVLLFGATGRLGLEIAEDLTAQGDRVTAFVRPFEIPADLAAEVAANLDASEEALEEFDPQVARLVEKQRERDRLKAMGATLIVGDAMQPGTIAAAFAASEFDAAITTVGSASADPPPDYIGNANIFDAAKAAGVDRVIMISTIGAGDSFEAAPWLSRVALSEIIPLKTQAEDHLKASGLDYTVIRPGGLSFGPGTGGGILSEDPSTMGFIVRSDLARLVADVLHDDRTIGRTFAAVDPALESPFDGGGA